MNITSSISSFLNNAKQPALGTIKRVWAVQPSIWSVAPVTDCIEVVVFDDGDVLVNHLVIDPRTREPQSRDYITDGDVDPETIKEVVADIRAYLKTVK